MMYGRDLLGHFQKWTTLRLCLILIILTGACPSWAAPKGSPWGRDYFPNVELTGHDGKHYKFYDDIIKDKVVAINFIYTQCGDSCPLETANLKRVYKLLGDRMGKDVHFYSISIDAERDDTKALKAYAERFNIGPGWLFLGGKKEDTVLLRKKLGLYASEGETKLSDHNTSFMLGNESTGQWIKKTPYDVPAVLAQTLSYTLSTKKKVIASLSTHYGKAEAITNYSEMGDLFQSRCASCHSLGKEDGIGPGLAGITQRREKAWLSRWLKEPDKMLAENDPIAVDLYNRYNKINMPNLKLDDKKVEGFIKFLENYQ